MEKPKPEYYCPLSFFECWMVHSNLQSIQGGAKYGRVANAVEQQIENTQPK